MDAFIVSKWKAYEDPHPPVTSAVGTTPLGGDTSAHTGSVANMPVLVSANGDAANGGSSLVPSGNSSNAANIDVRPGSGTGTTSIRSYPAGKSGGAEIAADVAALHASG